MVKFNLKVQKIVIPAAIMFVLILSSCSYGFFNFSSETGMIELEFDFIGVNVKNVDEIKYELTPPKGFSTSVKFDFKNNAETQRFDKVDIGTWNIRTILYSDGDEVQSFERNIEVIADNRTTLRIEADWGTTEYTIFFETWQYAIYDSEISTLTFEKIQVNPGIVEDYFSGEQLTSVNIYILGTDFEEQLRSLKLIYPDGDIYKFGYLDNYSRGDTLSHTLNNTIVEIKRTDVSEEALNGDYKLRMLDYQSNSIVDEYTLDLDYEALMPKITLPADYNASAGFSFSYDFGGAATTGTKFHYLIDASDNSLVYGNNYKFPPDDASLIGTDVGSFDIFSNQLTPTHTYLFVCAAIQYITITPSTDASPKGGVDFRPYFLVDSINNVYGENTGYVIATVVEFTAE